MITAGSSFYVSQSSGVVPVGSYLGLEVCIAGKQVPELMPPPEKECPLTTLRTRTHDAYEMDADLISRY
jgi:hypothetical protein